MESRLPTAAEINVYDSLDERYAVRNFLGKTLPQARVLFAKGFLHYCEDLVHMGPAAFCYYVHAATDYLVSPEASGDSDAVNCFCGMLEHRLKYDRKAIEVALPALCTAIRSILSDFDRYDCSPQIYGDLRGRYERVLKSIAPEGT